MQNRLLEEDTGRNSKLNLYRKYKFVIAFENAIEEDYVTEKFYDPLLAGSVPVYLGAPSIKKLPLQESNGAAGGKIDVSYVRNKDVTFE